MIETCVRPPVAFVVEGHGEHNCYPSLVCRLVGASQLNVPRVNAKGVGNIFRHLPEHLTDLCMAWAPYTVIVTIDLKDVLDEGLVEDCEALRQHLENEIQKWRMSAGDDRRISVLPERVVAVIQVRKFEAWLIADIDGLIKGKLVNQPDTVPDNPDAVFDPASWLRQHLCNPSHDIKNPDFAKEIISKVRPDEMAKSRSFDKFRREVISSYDLWVQGL